MKAKENPLNQSVTGNSYYDYLIHEVQVVCNCPTDKAMAIVSYVNSLGSSPIEFDYLRSYKRPVLLPLRSSG